MLRSYIYNEIKNAYTYSQLFDIREKIIRAERWGHLDTKSADFLLKRCNNRIDDEDIVLIF